MYGDLLSTPEDTNHVGRVHRVYDGAGMATTLEFDFKGNAVEEQRQLVLDKTTQPDWSNLLGESTIAAMAAAVSSMLDSQAFSASSQRDALNRVLVAISPDDSQVLCTYDEGGALQQVEVLGDITDIRDEAQQTVYFQNTVVEAANSYTYDAIYRLIEATGREHSTHAHARRENAGRSVRGGSR